MNDRAPSGLKFPKKLALAVFGIAISAAPVAIGMINAPLIRAQSSAQHGVAAATLLAISPGMANAAAQSAAEPSIKFEVASVKPSSPPGSGARTVGCKGGPGTTDPGLFTCSNIDILFLVTIAFDLQTYQLPEYADTTEYEISAKVPPRTTREQFDRMLQNLLAERFKLTYHYGKKEMTVYNLALGKSGIKMKESPPEVAPPSDAGTSDAAAVPVPRKPTLGPDGFPTVPPPSPGHISYSMVGGRARWATINTTTQALAKFLSFQLGQPVTDATGLKSKYDFTLSWVFDSGESTALSANFSGPTLPEAIQDQLGLKLELKKGQVNIFTIDHVERPSAN